MSDPNNEENLPPPELPNYEDIQKQQQEQQPQPQSQIQPMINPYPQPAPNTIYSTFYSSGAPNIYNNINNNNPPVTTPISPAAVPNSIYTQPQQQYIPSGPSSSDFITKPVPGDIQNTSPQPDTAQQITSTSGTIPNDPIHSSEKDNKQEALLVPVMDDSNLDYCERTCNRDEWIGIFLNLCLWGWMSLLVMSYVGVIHFPRAWGNIDGFDFGGGSWGGSSGGGDGLGILIVILIIIIIIILIILMPAIYPEFIFCVIYLAYVYWHYNSISFHRSRSSFFSETTYNLFLFFTFAEVYKFFARCCYPI